MKYSRIHWYQIYKDSENSMKRSERDANTFCGCQAREIAWEQVSMRFVFWLVEKKVTEKLLANHKALRYKKVSRQRVVETVQGSYIIWKSFLQALCIKCIYVSRASCLCDISQGYSLALETFKAIENSEKKFSAQGFWKSFLKYIVSYLKPIYMKNIYIYNLSVSCLWKRVENSVCKNLTYSVIRINLFVERLF